MIARTASSVLAAVLLLPGQPAWALNKCVAADGKVTYQEQPCASAERKEAVALPPTQAEIARKAAEKARREAMESLNASIAENAAKKEREDREMRAAIAKSMDETNQQWKKAESACGKRLVEAPSVGMREGEFLKCTAIGIWGHYSVNETQTAAGVSKQYVFTADAVSLGVRYVYVRNGVVNAIQR